MAITGCSNVVLTPPKKQSLISVSGTKKILSQLLGGKVTVFTQGDICEWELEKESCVPSPVGWLVGG